MNYETWRTPSRPLHMGIWARLVKPLMQLAQALVINHFSQAEMQICLSATSFEPYT